MAYYNGKVSQKRHEYQINLNDRLGSNNISDPQKIWETRIDPITGYKKPIYILMDRACGSSCEFTIAAFEWNKYVTRVGENTNGTFHFSNAGIAILPNSKIKVMIPSQYSEYYDHRFIERTGLQHDRVVSPGSDAYLETKKIISIDSID